MPKKQKLTEALRKAIKASGKTHYRLAKESGLKPDYFDRFVYGTRDIRLSTAGKICQALGLELRPKSADAPKSES